MLLRTLRSHWPEYAIEAWALGTFMLSAGVFTVLIEHPGSVVHDAIASALARRALIGLAMGVTAIALIYSPWGRRSGAHMNPAVTLTFLRLGRVARVDAAFFVIAQFAGAVLGAAIALALLGERFAAAPVNYVTTLPPVGGLLGAFALELGISCALMLAVLVFSNSARLMPFTGLVAGGLVFLFITFEAPFSGMSMNPARSFASAALAGEWRALWLYCTAPPIGMLTAAYLYTLGARRLVRCAKLYHTPDVRCIHCGYEPAHSGRADHEYESLGHRV